MAGEKNSSKYLLMFGMEKRGYTPERVDSYVTQLESTLTKMSDEYKKVKNAYSALKKNAGDGETCDEMVKQVEELKKRNADLERELENSKSKNVQVSDEELIGRVLIEARKKADEIIAQGLAEAETEKCKARIEIRKMESEKAEVTSSLKDLSGKISRIVNEASAGGDSIG